MSDLKITDYANLFNKQVEYGEISNKNLVHKHVYFTVKYFN